jgi:mono/diheme cytochrome c family protein
MSTRQHRLHALGPNRLRVVVAAAIALLAACGAGGAGDAASGKKLFDCETPIAGGKMPTCIGCHPVEPDKQTGAGPNLSNIGNHAATTVKGMSAHDYLRQSIVDPDAHLAGGYQEDIHPKGYGDVLTQQQIDDLIAYLLTLKSGK